MKSLVFVLRESNDWYDAGEVISKPQTAVGETVESKTNWNKPRNKLNRAEK